jgi:hypothetical protein
MNYSVKTIFKENKVLFSNDIWEISIFPTLHEIVISNNNLIFYGYPTKCKTKIFWDNTNFPKYLGTKAIKSIQKININSIYQ